ncbi:hypothetical protein EW026_g2904 [Hermanssonia centrifuga]|uniref:tripeptidyl-peptidase II n=1 Tax=Hermanssonia centrifuga TaxID=98765 RepID=A0A4S4KLT6_9APHY|nr:hypothetical protein EW026_g2904 [Hermanssonia centrifuga]
MIELRIALPQPNFDLLEIQLYEISDPLHHRYGQHLTQDEVYDLVTPHDESLSAVNEWLAIHGLLEQDLTRSPAKDWVKVDVPVSLAEEMLGTKYYVWVDSEGDSIVRTTAYSLPEHLHEHIELVQPTTLFSTLRGMKTNFHLGQGDPAPAPAKGSTISVPSAHNGQVDTSCNSSVTLSCLKQLYNAVGYTPSKELKNQIAVTGYLEYFANLQDLQLFYADQRPDAVNSSFEFVSINGGLNNQTLYDAGNEADLDTQFAFGMSYPIPATFYSTGGRPPFIPDASTLTNTNEPYLDWLDYILNHPNPPQTISYADHEQTVSPNVLVKDLRNLVGARGVSLLFSSGDSGVGDGNSDPHTTICISNDGHNTTQFIPLFPPSCPYVTAVGGTVSVPETAISLSGGGFSNYFDRPAYQAAAVPGYLNKLPKGTYKGLYNPKGRGIPDVAAQAENYRFFFQGRASIIGGTSAASPTFAGIVALLNDVRMKHGRPSLGFLNPLIYTLGAFGAHSGFNDITIGNNPGCGTKGFNATKGWDPVTGYGTPNFGELKELVLAI